ncbi:hypothetical protein J2W42_005301 [Rhizobium tibeticum]|nr:hypothetical protein [Rhizobium tibeticum]
MAKLPHAIENGAAVLLRMQLHAAQGNDPRTRSSLTLVREWRIFGGCKETTDGTHVPKFDDQHVG